MINREQQQIFGTSLRAATTALAIAIVFALMVVLIQAAQAQTFTVLHNFTGGKDGLEPYAGVTIDRVGNLLWHDPDGRGRTMQQWLPARVWRGLQASSQ